MKEKSHNFNFYRSFLLKVQSDDDIELTVFRCFETEEQKTKGQFKLFEINMNYLSIIGKDLLEDDQRVCLKLGIKSFLSRWDIYLYGKVVRSFQDVEGTNYGINLESNLELTYFLKEFINRFSSNRLKESLISSSLSEKNYSIHEGIEIISTLGDFYQLIAQNLESLDLQKCLSEVSKISEASEANLWLINTATDRLENIYTSRGEKYKDRDYREGKLGQTFCHQDIINTFDHKNSYLTFPFKNSYNKTIGVIELKREDSEKRFSYSDERNIRLLSVLFGSAFHHYDPLSGSSELEDFNLHLIEKRPYLGQSLNSQKINHMIRKIAHSNTPLMIIGEKGTGKTVFAKICLKKSPLYHYQTDQLDFSSVAPSEIDKVDWSEPGSIILESLEKLPKFYQRTLYERIVFGRKRVFTLCSHDLAPMTLSNDFYQPLYQHLSQAYFILQPLRQRKDELIGLASQILKNECLRRADKITRTFSPQTLQEIEEYDWPENYTEMEKLVRKALFKSPQSEMISLEIPQKNSSTTLVEQIIAFSDHTLDKKTLVRMLKETVQEHFAKDIVSSKGDQKDRPSKIAI